MGPRSDTDLKGPLAFARASRANGRYGLDHRCNCADLPVGLRLQGVGYKGTQRPFCTVEYLRSAVDE